MGAYVYMPEYSDGSYYVGSHRGDDIDRRVGEHQEGKYLGYTFTRRPVKLVWSEHYDRIVDAIEMERRLKGWSRAKKEALIAGRWAALPRLSRRGSRTLP